MIRTFVGMPRTAAVVFDHQVHLLDAFAPHDRVVFPEVFHRYIFFVHARLEIDVGPQATVAIWGQPELIEVARQWVSLLEDPSRLREMGGQPVTGVLLSGPPGSGKTHLARCMAGTAAVPFLGLDGSRLISMWLGVGSIKVMRLFANARKFARRYGACIVFIDELDAIGSSRGGVTGRAFSGRPALAACPRLAAGAGVLNTLLTQMDGIARAAQPPQGPLVQAARQETAPARLHHLCHGRDQPARRARSRADPRRAARRQDQRRPHRPGGADRDHSQLYLGRSRPSKRSTSRALPGRRPA